MSGPYRNDLDAARARIGTLERELADAERRLERRPKRWAISLDSVMSGLIAIIVVALGLVVVGGGYALARHLFSDGRVDFCYTAREFEVGQGSTPPTGRLLLKGFRPWNADAVIGAFETIDDVNREAVKYGCPLLRAK